MDPSSRNRNVKYPFNKARVYLNAVVVVLSTVFSVSLLMRTLNVLLLACYFVLTIVVTVLMYKIKLRLLSRMQGIRSETEELPSVREIEDNTLPKKWEAILIFLGVVLSLILPITLVFVLEPAWWFIGFTSFVTGLSLSEVVLYVYANKS